MRTILGGVLAFLLGIASPVHGWSLQAGNASGAGVAAASPASDENVYEQRTPSPDGTGRFYMGREISLIMGHLGAGWLERPEREVEERTDLFIERLDLESDYVVADIGAGTGYFTFPIAERVPDGRVLAVDIQPEMLAIIDEREASLGVDNVETILGEEDDPRLPEGSVDLVFIVDAYHEFYYPREMAASMLRGLRPGGRLVLLEYRAEDVNVPIRPLHKMTEEQAIRELTSVGFEWLETQDYLPQQHVLVFERP